MLGTGLGTADMLISSTAVRGREVSVAKSKTGCREAWEAEEHQSKSTGSPKTLGLGSISGKARGDNNTQNLVGWARGGGGSHG